MTHIESQTKRVPEPQLAGSVLMVRPTRFESNPLTAESNTFQEEPEATPAEQQELALAEFDGLVASLESAGIRTCVFADTREPHTPDSVFPNNWVSFHADGTVVVYPMEAENRRTERRMDIIEHLDRDFGFQVRRVIDLSAHEEDGVFLEGTGSMVLDRTNHVAFACLSSRTALDALGDFAQQLDYDIMAFDAVDRHGLPIYHTNVMMNVGEKVAVICADSIRDAQQRKAVLDGLRQTGHEILLLDYDQLESFAGNMLELRNDAGERVVAMSQQAYDSLTRDQMQVLGANGRIVATPIDNIESSAGGSVRCMLAEIHLPEK